MAKESCGFDVTISVAKSSVHYLDIVERLKKVFKEWVFQRELTSSGYDHWQVRGKLYKPKSDAAAVHAFREVLWNGSWSRTSSGVHQGKSFNYQMKLDTHKEGPWSSKDPALADPPVLTRQLRKFYAHVEETGMYPWQSSVEALIKREEDREIICIVEPGGNNGKSVFCEHLEYTQVAYEIPPVTVMEDLMAIALCIAAQKCYLVDMPRAMKKDKLAGFYAGLECLKNGTMYDKRYSFKKRRIDRPQIVVFTNTPPDKELLIADRWLIFYILHHELVPESVVLGEKHLTSV